MRSQSSISALNHKSSTDRLAIINFDPRVGRIIAQTCAKYLKPVVLELGGKAPLVVLDDANLEDAVNAATFGAFAKSGQICMSTERLVVDKAIADDFVARLVAKAQALPLGDPRERRIVPTVHDEAQMPFGGVKESGLGVLVGKLA